LQTRGMKRFNWSVLVVVRPANTFPLTFTYTEYWHAMGDSPFSTK